MVIKLYLTAMLIIENIISSVNPKPFFYFKHIYFFAIIFKSNLG